MNENSQPRQPGCARAGRCPMLVWIKYLRRVRVETDALKRNKDLASTRTPLSLVRDEGVAGSNPATPTNT